jgi:CheY-specific phosphatase CheX
VVAELGNLIVGQAKSKLPAPIEMSLPKLILGGGGAAILAAGTRVIMPFTTEIGKFSVEISE